MSSITTQDIKMFSMTFLVWFVTTNEISLVLVLGAKQDRLEIYQTTIHNSCLTEPHNILFFSHTFHWKLLKHFINPHWGLQFPRTCWSGCSLIAREPRGKFSWHARIFKFWVGHVYYIVKKNFTCWDLTFPVL